jgi:hypothetical protein
MGIEKIFIGVVIIMIGIILWFMLASPDAALTQVLFSTPAARYSFTQTFANFQFLYFFVIFAAGISIVLWGAQS